MHHNIEEVHIFPILGKRMPDFAKGSGEHLRQRKSGYRFASKMPTDPLMYGQINKYTTD